MQSNSYLKRFVLRSVSLATAAAMLAGCAGQSTVDRALGNVRESQRTAGDAIARAKEQATTAAVTRHKGPRLNGAEVVSLDASKQEPPILRSNFSYRSASQTFEGVMADVARSTGMAVRKVTPMSALNNSQSAGNSPGSAAALAAKTPGFTWEGPLAGFLDQLGRSQDLYWKFDERRHEVVFFREETRSFNVFVPTGEKAVSASIALAGAGGSGSGGSGGGGGGGSAGGGSSSSSGNVSVTSSNNINAFESVVMGVRGFVLQDQLASAQPGVANASAGALGMTGAGNRSGAGSNTQMQGVIANEGLGMITVTASPPTLDRIQSYIENLNQRFARNVYIGVRVYNLTVDDEAVNGVSIQAALANLEGSRSASVRPSGLAAPSSGTPGQFSLRLQNAGSSVDVVAQALSTFGQVSTKFRAQVIAANGQPAPFQVADDQTFLESSTTTVVANVGVSTTLQPGTRTVGLTGNFLPLVLNDNRILLQYQLNLSSMTLTEVRSGNSVIQTPRISRQALQQQAFVEDGESLVLFGFEQQRNVYDNSQGLLTVSNRGTTSRTMVVIVMDVYGDAKAKVLKAAPNA